MYPNLGPGMTIDLEPEPATGVEVLLGHDYVSRASALSDKRRESSLYEYTQSNPVKYVDPWGTFKQPPPPTPQPITTPSPPATGGWWWRIIGSRFPTVSLGWRLGEAAETIYMQQLLTQEVAKEVEQWERLRKVAEFQRRCKKIRAEDLNKVKCCIYKCDLRPYLAVQIHISEECPGGISAPRFGHCRLQGSHNGPCFSVFEP